MDIIKQTELNTVHKEQILHLWNSEYPEKLVYKSIKDFEKYLNNLSKQTHYLLINDKEEIEGWATTFIREGEKWFAIIISEKLQGKGIGTQMLNNLKQDSKILNGWVIDHHLDRKLNGAFYKSPLEFYQKNDFMVISETRLELEIMSAVKIKWTKKNK